MKAIRIEKLPHALRDDPLRLLQHCGGYYACPVDDAGNPIGPLVGYAGRYGPDLHQHVGLVYANFAFAERHASVLGHVANDLIDRIHPVLPRMLFSEHAVFCGAPEGGKALATVLAHRTNAQYIFLEKKVTAIATKTERERSELIFDRQEPQEGDMVFVVEDVCNNFSTTDQIIREIVRRKAKVAGIVCFLNRSLTVDHEFASSSGITVPVISVVRKPIEQFQQDDPRVAAHIAAGNVVWKPKHEWRPLMAAMEAAQPVEATAAPAT